MHHKWARTIRITGVTEGDKCLPRVENYEYNLLTLKRRRILVWGDEKSAWLRELFSDRLDDGTPPKVVLVSKDSEANNVVSWLLKKEQFEIKCVTGTA